MCAPFAPLQSLCRSGRMSLEATPIPKIHYFNFAGRAEFVKLLFEEKAQPYEFIPYNDKAPVDDKLAYGQLPLYEEGDFYICQSGTIVRYVAKKLGLYPWDLQEQSRAEMVVDGCFDLLGKYFHCVIYGTLKMEDFSTVVVPTWFGYFDKILKQNNSGKAFICADFCFADLCLFQILNMVETVAKGSLSAFPILERFHERISFRPNVMAYLQSNRRLAPT